jgi:hypothetical protein
MKMDVLPGTETKHCVNAVPSCQRFRSGCLIGRCRWYCRGWAMRWTPTQWCSREFSEPCGQNLALPKNARF